MSKVSKARYSLHLISKGALFFFSCQIVSYGVSDRGESRRTCEVLTCTAERRQRHVHSAVRLHAYTILFLYPSHHSLPAPSLPVHSNTTRLSDKKE
jgi:hypothetical protein